MGRPRLAIAAGNTLGARAAEEIARAGGNAVDACLASAVMAWVAEPFFASLAGSAFAAVRTPAGEVEVIDGNNSMPFTLPEFPAQGVNRTYFSDYADGMWTGGGAGSVAVPGALAAVHEAWRRHGRIEWAALFEPAIGAARDGFPFPRTSAYYLSATFGALWRLYESSRAVFAPGGEPLREGDLLVQAELATVLEEVAARGPEVFYGGDIGAAVTEAIRVEGGFMTLDDLASYRVEVRTPVSTRMRGWQVQSNPPPAVGGATLAHMLALLDRADLSDPRARLDAIVSAQRTATTYRAEHYTDAADVGGALEEALEALGRSMGSPETTHSSVADGDGHVCSLTESNGYGSGLVVEGILLNNTLGEEELNPLGIHSLPPGSRTHSNMAPTIATGPGTIVGLGSPGADRIVGAIAQTLARIIVDGDSLAAAVAAPRCHLDPREQGETLCYEPGLPGDALTYVPRPYDELHMYFGGVNAASVQTDGIVDAAHDPRRSGASALV